MSKKLEDLEKLISLAFVMSENMVGLSKGNYDEQEFIKKTYEYLNKYNVDFRSREELKKALQRLEVIDNAITICKKANEQKFIYIKESYGIVKVEFLDNLDYEILDNKLYSNSRGIYYSFELKDYGKDWALTKEELEND